MFGLGMPEILLILAIALIVIGPKKLPELAKTLGRAMGEFKRSAQDLKRSIDMETTLQDVHPAATDSKDEALQSRQAEKDTDAMQTETGQDKENTPENKPADDARTTPESDGPIEAGSGDNKADNP